ncbi:MAG: YceI family protein [Caldilineaceae bacterium]|nr:YceI family protein [Caldilineaceae bacterium]
MLFKTNHVRSTGRFWGSLIVLTAALFLIVACSGGGATTAAPTADAPAAEPTAASAEESASDAGTDSAAAAADESADAAPAEEASGADGALVLAIVPEESQARFYIDEVLMGADKTVEGVTSLVEGELSVDPANPGATQVGTITIDASDFTTDDNRRTRSVRERVLKTNQAGNQYITFVPTAIDGLPESVTVGESFDFTITGDLTIAGVTRPVTFAMSVTPESETRITGLGSATVAYADFDVAVPRVPMVAGVVDDVLLEIEFTAASGG